MDGSTLIIFGIFFLWLGYFFYGKYLARIFGVNFERLTPAHILKDGVDYVPTNPFVLFGHHFASIAGAGPILGPILASYFGWLPVVLWIVLGGIFIGAFHDFASLFVSVRHDGRSIGYIVEKYAGYLGRQLFLLFCWAALILVVAIFGLFIANTFVKIPPTATSSILFILIAPLFGFLVYRKNLPVWVGTVLFVPLVFLSVYIGTLFPLDIVAIGKLFGYNINNSFACNIWFLLLMFYCYFASIIPVWLLLQPRDFLNSFLLYIMIIFGIIGILVVHPQFKLDMFCGYNVTDFKGDTYFLFPLLFVTVACGACSGFHSLVASGTTSKQIDNEKHILPIGYGGMLVESLLAIVALASVAWLSKSEYFEILKSYGPVGTFANGLATFGQKMGVDYNIGLNFVSLSVSAFLLTTLDTATRIARLTWEELFDLPMKRKHREKRIIERILTKKHIATFIAVISAMYLAYTGNAMQLWPIFGSANQLLAALTLLVITIILVSSGKSFRIALFPMIFMVIVCITALTCVLAEELTAVNINYIRVLLTILLILLGILLSLRSVVLLYRILKSTPQMKYER